MAKKETKKITTTKLSEEEVNQLKSIQSNNEAVVIEFGKISLSELSLSERKERAQNYLVQLKASEVTLAKALEEKYGKGTVNTSTGEFTAIK